MTASTPTQLPSLAPPGAGLPKLELFFARFIFKWGRSRTCRGQAATQFDQRKGEILRLVSTLDAVTGAQRVLIPRLRGLEDSSRYWSVFMTLDHLRIVNDAVGNIISSLVSGHVPDRQASTADVKPDINVDSSAVTAFQESCLAFEKSVSALPNLETALSFSHPWFGPINAAGWHFLAGFHMNLHRKQIEAILTRMPQA